MTDRKNQEQIDKFIQAAKDHGCDEDEKTFDEKLKKLSKPKEKPAK